MSKDQAAKIAAREYATDQYSEDHEVAHANAYRPRLERAIRRAIQQAATFAMLAERARIRSAVTTRSRMTKNKTVRIACGDIMSYIEGPLSGAPLKGAVKK